jgi:hypothetical protein
MISSPDSGAAAAGFSQEGPRRQASSSETRRNTSAQERQARIETARNETEKTYKERITDPVTNASEDLVTTEEKQAAGLNTREVDRDSQKQLLVMTMAGLRIAEPDQASEIIDKIDPYFTVKAVGSNGEEQQFKIKDWQELGPDRQREFTEAWAELDYSKAGEGVGADSPETEGPRAEKTGEELIEDGITERKSKLELTNDSKEKKRLAREIATLELPQTLMMMGLSGGDYYPMCQYDALRLLRDQGMTGVDMDSALGEISDDVSKAYIQAELDLQARGLTNARAAKIISNTKDKGMFYLLNVWTEGQKMDSKKWEDSDAKFFGRRISEGDQNQLVKSLGVEKYIDWKLRAKKGLMIALVALLIGGGGTAVKESMPDQRALAA